MKQVTEINLTISSSLRYEHPEADGFENINCNLSSYQRNSMDKIRIPGGETKDVWFGVNVRGKVFYAIRAEGGRDRAKFWWIKWGVGNIEDIGDLIGDGSLDIPINVYRGIVSAKLRCTADVKTIVYISDTVSVDATVSFDW